MPRAHFAAALATTALLALGAPAGASADSGVTVDHDSPSAKEYAVPLDRAREDASGSGSSKTFGEGVGDDASGQGAAPTTTSATPAPAATPAPKPAEKQQPHRKAKKRRPAKQAARTTATTPETATTPAPARSAAGVPAADSTGDGMSSTAVLAGGGGLVALVGVATALWVRRRPGASR